MSKMSELHYETRMAAEPKFAETYCSQCGQNLGPGDSGVSHCRDHMHDQPRPSLREAAQAVIDRWESPNWVHDAVHTGELIFALREALRESNLVCLSETHQQLGEQLGEVSPKIGEQLGEDIIGMVRKACDPDKVDAWQNGFWVLTQTELERFAALVAAAEREACAKVVENYAGAWDDQGYALAQAIRARGQG